MDITIVQRDRFNWPGGYPGREAEARIIDQELRYWRKMEKEPERMIGRCIASLVDNNQLMHLGYSSLKDYARERVGISAREAQSLAQIERALAILPVTSQAYDDGVITKSHVRIIIRTATPQNEAEMVREAQRSTVRQMEGKKKRTPTPGRWLEDDVPLEVADGFEHAMELIRRQAGAELSQSECLEIMMVELLQTTTAFEVQATLPVRPVPEAVVDDDDEPVVPRPKMPRECPIELDERLTQAVKLKQVARVEMMDRLRRMSQLVLFREPGYDSMRRYADERLGMKPRTVQGLLALAHDLLMNDGLRDALTAGRINESHAKVIAAVALGPTVKAWIEYAETTTVLKLKAEADRVGRMLEEGRMSARECVPGVQMCAHPATEAEEPTRRLRVFLPQEMEPAWGDVQDVMEKLVGRPLTIGEVLFAVSNCYLRFYKELEESMARNHKIPMRDGMRCQVLICDN